LSALMFDISMIIGQLFVYGAKPSVD